MSKLDEAAATAIEEYWGPNDSRSWEDDHLNHFKAGALWLLREAGKLETQEGCQACRLIDAVQIEDLRKLVEG